jgi:uncharacterized membrane protein
MSNPVKIYTSDQTASRANWFAAVVVPLVVIAILLLATGLRFYMLDAQSFWNDEGNSARLSERTLPLIIEGTASDVHPPLYYVLLRGWRELLGESEFGLRSFSAFAGILTAAVTITLSRFLFSPGRRNTIILISLFTGLLTALSPTLVYYSQETRMYALLAFISSLSTLTLLCWLTNRRRWPWGVGYVLLSTAGLYTHYFYPTVFAVQGVIVLTWLMGKYRPQKLAPVRYTADREWPRILLQWLLMIGMSFILYLPWLPIFLHQTTGRSSERSTVSVFLWDSLRWMTFGETIANDDLIWVTGVVILLLIWAVVRRGWRIIIPVFGVLLPVAAMYIAGTTNPAFFKFMIIAVPFLLIWLASSLDQLGGISSIRLDIQNGIAWILMLIVLGGMLISLRNLYDNPAFARADYRAMAATITAVEDMDAAIILDAPNQWEVFTYYYRGDIPVYPLPKGQPDPQILEPQLAEIADNYERLYVLYWGDEQRDPDHVIENWLDTNTFKASERWVGDVRFAIYATSEVPDEQLTPLDMNFGDKVILNSANIADEKLTGGDIIQVTLHWSAEILLEDRYKVFIHLVDQDGGIVAQQDSEPVGGMSLTNSWQPGEIVIDKQGVVLPETIAPGEYQLLIGLYDINDPGTRLQIENLPGNPDNFVLGTIIVE